ncbi:MAG TPA: hypothetical protein VM677_09710 [Actinokineospora sp.]|jgi:hypothetical protein|nr:hypothetical protein [Actinokineospora sp.]
MTEAIEKLDTETREQLLQHLGVSDASELAAEDENHDEIVKFFEEQVSALQQEVEAVKTRIAYLLEQLPQYTGGQ